jgi:glycyl-tRNA synthetase beta chain
MSTQDFLLELGTEELPPKLLKQLSNALSGNLTKQLSELNLSFDRAETFATPRRLAVLVHNLQLQQNNQTIERKGPAVTAHEQAVAGFMGIFLIAISTTSGNKYCVFKPFFSWVKK